MTSFPPDRRVWAYDKTYSWYSDPAPQRDHLPYVAVVTAKTAFSSPGIPNEQIEWCRVHCVSAWAWWFDADTAYVGFADEQERFLFLLTCQ